MNQGRSVFAQIVELLPRRAFDKAVRRYGGHRRVRSLSCMDQLLSMIFAQLTGQSSLRQTVLSLQAMEPHLYHCGFRAAPARSTLADANERRDWRIFRDTALAMIRSALAELPMDPDLRSLNRRVYAVDSTTIDLCLATFPWARFRRRKAAIKAHTLFDIGAGIPIFVRVSSGNTHDLKMLDQMPIRAGGIYVMDKAYIDFERLHNIHKVGAFFVTRAKRNLDATILQRRKVPAGGPVTSDHFVRLRGPKSSKRYPDTLRVVRYVDPKTRKSFRFLTNNLLLDAPTIALLYRKRWRIELFFRWAKQHLHIESYFGVTPNAVQTQVWIAVILYVLLLKLRHRHGLNRELHEVFQILRIAWSEKKPVFQCFAPHDVQIAEAKDCKQWRLFE